MTTNRWPELVIGILLVSIVITLVWVAGGPTLTEKDLVLFNAGYEVRSVDPHDLNPSGQNRRLYILHATKEVGEHLYTLPLLPTLKKGMVVEFMRDRGGLWFREIPFVPLPGKNWDARGPWRK